MRILAAVLLFAGLVLSSAHAQTGTAERPAVWLGLGTEFFLIPEVQLSASAPVYRTSSVNVNVRGTVDASFGLYALGADVLLNQGDRGWY